MICGSLPLREDGDKDRRSRAFSAAVSSEQRRKLTEPPLPVLSPQAAPLGLTSSGVEDAPMALLRVSRSAAGDGEHNCSARSSAESCEHRRNPSLAARLPLHRSTSLTLPMLCVSLHAGGVEQRTCSAFSRGESCEQRRKLTASLVLLLKSI